MRVLHLHSSFDPGAGGSRAVRLINAFGKGCRHVIVSADPNAYGASTEIERGIDVSFPRDFPPLAGKPTPGRLQRLAKAMRGHDLILTYGWGAIDAVMAHTLFGEFHCLSPLVHHEDGLDEAGRMRTWYRRIAFGRTSMVIVPSRGLEAVARGVWQLPAGKVRRIADGIDTAAYGRKAKPDALRRVVKRPGERWLGALAGSPDLLALAAALATLPEEWQLVILGESAESEAIRDEALRFEVAHRVHLPGPVAAPAQVMGLFDCFALSSGGSEMTGAMAAGLPIVAHDTGDAAEMVAEENRPFIAAPGDAAALAPALQILAEDEVLRRRVGDANRRRAKAEYDAKAMIAAYRAAYGQALRRSSFP